MAALEGLVAVIPVSPRPEPEASTYDFRHDVYERGEDAIRQLAGLRPLRIWKGKNITAQVTRVEDVSAAMLRRYPYWRRAMPALHRAYGGYCAYLARYIEPVETPTTDHFVALRNATDPLLAYMWSNYRLAHAFVNSVKSAIPDVLDPFEIERGWFAIDFGTFKTVVGPDARLEHREAVSHTIRALNLDGRALAVTRRRAAERYWSAPPGHAALPIWALETDEPFLASELRRQGRLNPGDT
ncbi:hypothetical protein [Enhygromyxa salina]|uniref:Uncharacterized protein n=1 Tax=Enhygromyxa salina TaxID=215803 RepID=A0A2S9XQH8_9BACT|nr:hypothetical protein [Enhygromyxa salina]PRP95106.1 hypothetical protein ENSA7_74200 [Enhygromyxa salina]